MSWEVSSMLSKRSFFNRTLFRKNLTRFWPLWGGAALAGAMVPLYLLLALVLVLIRCPSRRQAPVWAVMLVFRR